MVGWSPGDNYGFFLCRVALLVFLAALSFSYASVGVDSESRKSGEPNGPPEAKRMAEAGGRRSAAGSVSGAFRGSLEMKENADFLLTPALIVQQVVSRDPVMVYPSE